MDNPINEVKKAALSALTIRNILMLLVGLLALCAVLDLAGWTNAFFQPVTSFKSWNKKRQATSKSA